MKSYMWVHIRANAKTIVLSHKSRGGNTSQIISTQTSTIIVEKTENLPNSSSHTIEHKIVRNSHLLLHKIWHFLKCHSNCSTNQTSVNCSYAKSSKQQLTAHTSIVKGNTTKCYKHAPFSSNALLCSLVLKSQLTLPRKIQNK